MGEPFGVLLATTRVELVTIVGVGPDVPVVVVVAIVVCGESGWRSVVDVVGV